MQQSKTRNVRTLTVVGESAKSAAEAANNASRQLNDFWYHSDFPPEVLLALPSAASTYGAGSFVVIISYTLMLDSAQVFAFDTYWSLQAPDVYANR
jgi:hypothetical protein